MNRIENGQKPLIIVPTFNEKDNLKALVEGIFKALGSEGHILFIDDNSPDGTGDAVEDLRGSPLFSERIFLLRRPAKLGLGSAYKEGFSWGLQRGYSWLIEMDADLSHRPEYLPNMINLLKGHDVVIGSRYITGGGTQNWGFLRRLISQLGCRYAQTILGLSIRDLTGGFNGWRRDVLAKINPDTLTSEGYSFQIELKFRAYRLGFKIVEFPIVFFDRRVGQSKMRGRIVIEALWRVFALRWRFRK